MTPGGSALVGKHLSYQGATPARVRMPPVRRARKAGALAMKALAGAPQTVGP